MSKIQLVSGQTFKPKAQQIKVTENSVTGNRWQVFRDGNNYYFEFDTGELVEHFKKIKITKNEFHQTKKGNIDNNYLIKKYLA